MKKILLILILGINANAKSLEWGSFLLKSELPVDAKDLSIYQCTSAKPPVCTKTSVPLEANKSLRLKSGFYWLSHSGMINRKFEITTNNQTEIQMTKISVPKIFESYQVTVTPNLTLASERENFYKLIYLYQNRIADQTRYSCAYSDL